MQLNISDKQERYLLLLSSAVLFILHCTFFSFRSVCLHVLHDSRKLETEWTNVSLDTLKRNTLMEGSLYDPISKCALQRSVKVCLEKLFRNFRKMCIKVKHA